MMDAVRLFVKNVEMKIAYAVADRKNRKKYDQIKNPSEYSKSPPPTTERMMDKDRNRHMKLNHQLTHNASDRNAIIIMPSLNLASFSLTNWAMQLDTG